MSYKLLKSFKLVYIVQTVEFIQHYEVDFDQFDQTIIYNFSTRV